MPGKGENNADWGGQRDASNPDAPRQMSSCLWSLPGGSQPAGEEGAQLYLNSFNLDHDDGL